jgi:hypothetical protein
MCFMTFDVAHTAAEEDSLSGQFSNFTKLPHLLYISAIHVYIRFFSLYKNNFGIITGYKQLDKTVHLAFAHIAICCCWWWWWWWWRQRLRWWWWLLWRSKNFTIAVKVLFRKVIVFPLLMTNYLFVLSFGPVTSFEHRSGVICGFILCLYFVVCILSVLFSRRWV